VRGERRQADAEDARDTEPDPPSDAVPRHRLGGRRVERRKPLRRAPGTAVDRRHSSPPGQPSGGRGALGLGGVLDLLVDLLDLLGDARPGVVSRRFACRATHGLSPGRVEIDPL
jgi:hypothetical protein